MDLLLHAISHVGLIRSNNEDIAFLGETLVRDGAAARRISLDAPGPWIFGVADGVGGANAGEVASRKAAVGMLRALSGLSGEPGVSELSRQLWSFLEGVHNDILRDGSATRRNHGMATTYSALVAYRRELIMLHAGDSRVYRLAEGRLEQLSRDHTVRAMTNNPAIPGNILANCLGISSDFFADVSRLGNVDTSGQLYLICSDGLSDLLEHEEVEQIMKRDAQLSQVAEWLVAAAIDAGGRDNITLVLARVDSDG